MVVSKIDLSESCKKSWFYSWFSTEMKNTFHLTIYRADMDRSRLRLHDAGFFYGEGFSLGFGFLDFLEPGFGFVIFKGFGFVVYQSLDFATNLFDCKNTCNNIMIFTVTILLCIMKCPPRVTWVKAKSHAGQDCDISR